MNNLRKVALRYRALFLDIRREDIDMTSVASQPVLAFVARLVETGFCVNEELLHALNVVPTSILAEITGCVNDVMGVNLNWAPLVKGWNVPTGETLGDHLVTWIANIFGKNVGVRGTTLQCGHLIPEATFPIERYNGCPFCGKPFRTADFVFKGQGSKLKELRLFTVDDMRNVFVSLLESPTPLDATQKDSLGLLLREFSLPDSIDITMRETAMLVVRLLVEQNRADEASELMRTPADVLRYLWYEKTGHVQIIEPKALVANARSLYCHMWGPLDRGADAAKAMKKRLMLKYNRMECLRVAKWMNAIPMTARLAAENMNPKRGMWVRVIRALRLCEYARRKGFAHLENILDVFYRHDYSTWQGRVDKARSENDADKTLALLKERPGAFARCLFSTMLDFGTDKVCDAFEDVAGKLPPRLLLSLLNAAYGYFNPRETRVIRLVTGFTYNIAPNKLLDIYSDDELNYMVETVKRIFMTSMEIHFAGQPTEAQTIYIDSALYNIPVGVGDRTATIQDTSCALMGTRFPIDGNEVRLFLQWGKGLHAQMLDMDLSCSITLPDNQIAECAYYNLTCVGAKHSGDIREIPEMVGTAEYIELSLPELEAAGARYVTFTCNAYSAGALSANLVVGWMCSDNPMVVSELNGVAYDPSCVQHMVRVSEGNMMKGLVLGVLDVPKREIVWLEVPFMSQNLKGLDVESVETLLRKIESKLSVGQLLDIKMKAQNLSLVGDKTDADEAYTYEWALNLAEVSKLLVAG